MQSKLVLMASSAMLSLAMAASAQAQGTTIEELVVTAEKREQSLQDVPVAISAFTNETRDLVGINSVQDMTNFTPGLTYNNSGDRVTLRGVGRISNVQAADGAVAIYSDGIFTSSTFEASKQPLFIDRVEVLRGPQGTLYGRNSIGGAINVISTRPTDTFQAEVRGTVANYETTILQGTMSGPLAEGLRMRVNGSWEKQRKGWYDNIVPGTEETGNVIDQLYGEIQFEADFGERADGWVKLSTFNWSNGDGGLGGRGGFTPAPYNTTQEQPSVFYLNQGYGCSGQVFNVVNRSPTGCVNPTLNDERAFANSISSKVTLRDTWVLASEYTFHMDTMDLRYIGGGARYHYTLYQDNDGGPINAYTIPIAPFNPAAPAAGQPCAATNLFVAPGACQPLQIFPDAFTIYEEDKKWISHELNLSSTHDGPLQWLVGAYYYKEAYEQPVSVALLNQPQFAAPVNGPPNPTRRWYDTRPDFEARSYAFFGQIDWQFTDTLKMTAGLRYSDDHKYGQEEARLVCFALIACGTTPQILGSFTPSVDITAAAVGSGRNPDGTLQTGVSAATVIDPTTGLAKRELDASWDAITGTLGFDWTPTDDTLAYAKYSRGYKAGGFNSGIVAPVVANPYTDKEQNNAYEIGVKQNFGTSLQVNAAAFYYDYSNFQAPVSIVNTSGGIGTAQTLFFNIPEAVSKGFEVEINWAPINNLRLLASYSYNDAEIKKATGVIDSTDPTATAVGATPVGRTFAECFALAANPAIPAAQRCSTDIYTGLFQRGQDLKGNSLPQAPKHKLALNALYTVNMTAGDLTGSVSYIYRDVMYGTIFERGYNKSPDWDQVDLRLTFKDKDDRFTIIGYAKNLFDTLGYYEGATSSRRAGINPLAGPLVQGISTTYGLTPPRTYGVEVQYRF